MLRKRIRNSLLLFLLVLLLGNNHAQQEIKNYNYFIYPQYLAPKEYKHSIIVFAAKLPEDVVEEASNWIFAPVFVYSTKFGITKRIALTGRFSTNIITYNFSLGARWIHRLDQFSVSLGYEAAHFFGYLTNFGFQSKIYGWFTYPNITIGYQFKDFALAIRAEALILVSFNEYIDDLEVKHNIRDYDGLSLGFYIEQPLWKKNVIILGMKFTVSKFYYPAWMAFTRFDRHLLIGETVLGVNL